LLEAVAVATREIVGLLDHAVAIDPPSKAAEPQPTSITTRDREKSQELTMSGMTNRVRLVIAALKIATFPGVLAIRSKLFATP